MSFRRYVESIMLATVLIGALPSEAVALRMQEQSASPAPTSAVYVPTEKDERGLWMEMDEQERRLRTSNFVVRDAALNAYVHRVFCRTVGPDCETLRLYIVRTPRFNATTSPNGMIELYSGTFLRMRDEAQLAAVLAHEYVHYRDHHVIQLWREARSKAGAATFFAAFGLGLIGLAVLAEVFSFSREQERAADAGSVDLIRRAGYNPIAASNIWEQIRAEADATAAARKVKSRKDKNGGMFATHPPTAERMAYLKTLAEATPAAPAAVLNRAEYRSALAPFWASFIDDQIKLNDFGASEFLISDLAKEGWTPQLNYARGELYRARGTQQDMVSAIGFYREASSDPTAPPEVWRGLGLSLLRSGSAADGQAALKDYLVRRPEASDKAMIAMLAGI
ncbi:peptidase M48 [Sphingomonas sp. HMWF008]|nr:peptidase M48 [Sphingomonas sp. HMWF008]